MARLPGAGPGCTVLGRDNTFTEVSMLGAVAAFIGFIILSIALAPFMPFIAIGITLWRSSAEVSDRHALV